MSQLIGLVRRRDKRIVFISYRRDANSQTVGRLDDALTRHFGGTSVFRDKRRIKPGDDFPQQIRSAIERASISLVILNENWATATDAMGRGLDDPKTWVRQEVEMSLADPSRRVVPIVVDQASRPLSTQLPDSMKALLRRDSPRVNDDNFRTHMEKLIELCVESGVRRSLWRRIGAAGRTAVLVGAGALLYFLGSALWAPYQSEQRVEAARATMVDIADIAIERYEVSNARYARCVDDGACEHPALSRTDQSFDVDIRQNLPVVSVSATQAHTFCEWLCRQLPTREQWEVAASNGVEGQVWPWGSEEIGADMVHAVFVIANQEDPDFGPEEQDRMDELIGSDGVSIAELRRLLPQVPVEELEAWPELWPSFDPAERSALLMQALGIGLPRETEVDTPSDVIAVDSLPDGATSASGGVHHLYGNAAEWTRTSTDGEVWDGSSPATLWVVGGSFGVDRESLKQVRGVASDKQLEDVGFRCVATEGN